MKTRVLSGLIMLPLLAVVYFGDTVLLAACFLIAFAGIREFYGGFEKTGVKPCYPIGYASAAALYLAGFFRVDSGYYMLWFSGVVLASLLYYIVFFSFHAVLIDQSEYSVLIWLVLLTAFGTDSMAYFTGYLLGKNKLCPKISPKKTVEGAIGGIIGSIVLCGLFGYFMAGDLITDCIIIGFAGSIISQFGDLTASVFKRKMGIKDYGNLIPGHGGVLDRFDSVLFTAPLVYYYILFVIY